MPEFMIEIDMVVETEDGDHLGEEELLLVDDNLIRDPRAVAPALSINTEAGSLGATFTVEAETVQGAGEVAWDALVRALMAAVAIREGYVGDVDRLLIERVLDREAVPV